ncbi:MAG: leucine-rich repeat protein [Clostridia bacterium]|nr:leucine-rich repeat protein [Clostridia bacterium]
MRKKTWGILLVFALFILTLALSGCETKTLRFSSESYTVQVGTSFSPNVDIRPKSNSYSITTNNSTVATVNNNVVTANREGVTTLTVSSGSQEATATLYCVTDPVDDPSDVRIVTTYTVRFFIVNYSEADLATGELESVYAYEGSTIDVNVPLVRGFSVDAWYVDESCTKRFDLSTPITSSITLYAKLTQLDTDYAVSNNLVTGLLYPNLPHEELILPDSVNGAPVYGVADEAFLGDSGIKRVVFPSTYRTVGTSAFAGCENLEEVVVPEGCRLMTIGVNAFGVQRDQYDRITTGCGRLTTIDLPDTVTRIGAYAFYHCYELILDGLPAGLTEVEQYAFAGTKLNYLSLRNISIINEGAFYGCSTLDTVTDTSSVRRCAKYAFAETKLVSDARKAYSGSPSGKKDDFAAYYVGTILYDCYDYYGTMGGSGKLHVKEGTTLIADDAFNDSHQSELTLYIDAESARAAIGYDFIGRDAFVESDGVFIVVPEDLLSTYKSRYSDGNEGRDYADKFVCEVVLDIDGNVDTINYGRHVLLRKDSADGSEYYYDRYVGEASIVRLGQLPLPYDVVRINMNAFTGLTNLQILGVGRVRSIAYYAVSDCGKTTVTEIIDGVETPKQQNVFTRLEFTDAISPTVLEDKNSVRFDDMPELYAYVKASDLTSYRSIWEGKATALSRLIGE